MISRTHNKQLKTMNWQICLNLLYFARHGWRDKRNEIQIFGAAEITIFLVFFFVHRFGSNSVVAIPVGAIERLRQFR